MELAQKTSSADTDILSYEIGKTHSFAISLEK